MTFVRYFHEPFSAFARRSRDDIFKMKSKEIGKTR
jgi:hypothetical protein